MKTNDKTQFTQPLRWGLKGAAAGMLLSGLLLWGVRGDLVLPAIGIMMCSLPAAGLAYILGNKEVQRALFDDEEEE